MTPASPFTEVYGEIRITWASGLSYFCLISAHIMQLECASLMQCVRVGMSGFMGQCMWLQLFE